MSLLAVTLNVQTATCGGCCFQCDGYGTCSIAPSPGYCPVSSNLQFNATAYNTNGQLQNINGYGTWSSTNTSIAQPQSTAGLIRGVAVGTATINFAPNVYKSIRICNCVKDCPLETGCGVGMTVITASVTTANITSDQITVELSGGSTSGTLTVNVGSYQVVNQSEAPGTYTFSFKPSSLPVGQYSSVNANWVVGGSTASGSKAVSFNVLGVYTHSQYNTPTESSCTASGVTAIKSSGPSACTYSNITLKSDFISQSWENGSGITINYGAEQNEAICAYPPGFSDNFFRPVTSIVPSCLSPYSVSNTTVARLSSNANLTCGDQVLIVGLGTGVGTVKTVTDACPTCTATQLDNYTTQTACKPGSFGNLGNFTTIRVNR